MKSWFLGRLSCRVDKGLGPGKGCYWARLFCPRAWRVFLKSGNYGISVLWLGRAEEREDEFFGMPLATMLVGIYCCAIRQTQV